MSKRGSLEKIAHLNVMAKEREAAFRKAIEESKPEDTKYIEKLLEEYSANLDLEKINILAQAIFEQDISKFNIDMGEMVLQCFDDYPIDNYQKYFWRNLVVSDSASDIAQYRYKQNLVANVAKNILSLYPEEISYQNHPLLWKNNYLLENVLTVQDHKKIWQYGIRNKDPNIIHYILSAYSGADRRVEGEHPLVWGDLDAEAAEVSANAKLIFEMIGFSRVPSKAKYLSKFFWDDKSPEEKKAMWFEAILKGNANAVRNILSLYSGQEKDENHPVNWLGADGFNAIASIFLPKNIANIKSEIIDVLLEQGSSFPEGLNREEVLAAIKDCDFIKEAEDSFRALRHHDTRRQIAIYVESHKDEGVPNIDKRMQDGFERILNIYKDNGSADLSRVINSNAGSLKRAYQKVCIYCEIRDGEAVDPKKLEEILSGSRRDLIGRYEPLPEDQALTGQERQAIYVVMSGGTCLKEGGGNIVPSQAFSGVVESLISKNREAVIECIHNIDQFFLTKTEKAAEPYRDHSSDFVDWGDADEDISVPAASGISARGHDKLGPEHVAEKDCDL